MNVIYIPSGRPQIYEYLDNSIGKAIRQVCQGCSCIQPTHAKTVINEIESSHVALTLLGDQLDHQTMSMLKKANVKLAVWLTEDPFYFDKSIKNIRNYDFIFTIDSGALRKYRSIGFSHVYHLPLGTDPAIFAQCSLNTALTSDVLLVGYPYPSRVQLVQYLLCHGDFSITLIGQHWHNQLGKTYRNHPRLHLINQWLEPEIIAKYYQGAKIVLNPHRRITFQNQDNKMNVINETMNNRTFDIAASGAFQLINHLPDLRTFFTEEEMISYQTFADCLEKINKYVNSTEIRQQIANRAKNKVQQHHTFQQRIETIIKIVERHESDT